MLTIVDYKAWARTHKSWWINPLEEHSNHDGYDKNLTNIIDNWIKCEIIRYIIRQHEEKEVLIIHLEFSLHYLKHKPQYGKK